MLPDTPLVTAYFAVVVGLLGLCMGSFLNCLAWRLTHGESVMHGRSHCTTCGHVLGPRDLVPVLSWALSHGRCRYCGSKVSARYPATELLCAIIYVSIFCRYGLTPETVELIAFASVLLVLSLTDLDDYIIPNPTIVVAILIRLVYIAAGGAFGLFDPVAVLVQSLIGGFGIAVPVLVLSLVMDHVLGRDSLGGGDVKLLFVAGLYFGWQQCLLLLIIACVLGIVFGMLGTRVSTDLPDSEPAEDAEPHLIPFGPSIAAACWIIMLIGPQVLDWYRGLLHL